MPAFTSAFHLRSLYSVHAFTSTPLRSGAFEGSGGGGCDKEEFAMAGWREVGWGGVGWAFLVAGAGAGAGR